MADTIYLECNRTNAAGLVVTTFYPHERGVCGTGPQAYTDDVVARAKEITRAQISVPTGHYFRRRVCVAPPPLITAVYTYRYADGGLSVYVFGQAGQILRSALTRQNGSAGSDTVAMNSAPEGYGNPVLFPLATPAPYGATHHQIAAGSYVLTIVDSAGNVLFTADEYSFTDSQPTGQLLGHAATTVALPRILAKVRLDSLTPPPADPFVDTNLTTVRRAGLGPFVYHPDPDTGGIPAIDRAMVVWSKDHHYDCFFPVIRRRNVVDPQTKAYDFRLLDSLLALADETGLLMIPQFDMITGSNDASTALIAVEERMMDHLGNVLDLGSETVASYDSIVDRAAQEAYLTAMLGRMAASPYAAKVAGIYVAGGSGLETEYGTKNLGQNVSMDFSAPSMAKFRQRAQEWYGTIGTANTAWGKAFASFAAIQRTDIDPGSTGSFYNADALRRDFFKHRTLSIAEYSNWWHTLVKAKSERIKTIYRTGSLYDGQSINRGTIALLPYLQHDIIIQDNDPSYPLAYAHTLGLRDQRASYGVGENPFQNDDLFFTEDTVVAWMSACYANYGSINLHEALYPIGFTGEPSQIIAAQNRLGRIIDRVHAQYPIGAAIVRPPVDTTIQLNALTLLTYTHENAQAGIPSYKDQFTAARQGGAKQVALHLSPLP